MANWSNAVSGSASGAISGSALGPWGTAGGAIIGAIPGLIEGKPKKNRDYGGGSSGGGMGWFDNIKNFFTGTPATRENISTLRPEQEPLLNQAINAGLNKGAGGAFGDAADYYRGNLSNNPEDFNAFAAPGLRQFNEEIIPGLSEQFAGMGSGGLSSSGFRNAAVNAGTDLSERLGAIRAGLRQQSAQGLQNIGQVGLNNYSQNVETQGSSPGLLSQITPAIGTEAIKYGSDWLKSKPAAPGAPPGVNSNGGNTVGANSGPYGTMPTANSGNGFNLPKFGQR